MGFQISYTKLLEVAFWHHAYLRTSTYNPATHNFDISGYIPGSSPFVLPLSTAVPTEAGTRLLTFDLREFVRIAPSTATSEVLDQLGLVFKTTTLGFWVVHNDLRALSAVDPPRFTFTVSLINPSFIDQINVQPDWPGGRIFHFTNAEETPAVRFLLSDNGATGEVLHSNHFYNRQGRVVRLPQLVAGTATTLQVHDDLAPPADPPVLTEDFPAINGQTEYELDARVLPEGRYRISGANINNVTLYLGLENQPGLIGVIDILPLAWEGTVFDIRLAEA